LHPDFLSLIQEAQLLAHLKALDWTALTNRRVRHYGQEAERLGGRAELPDWLQEVRALVEAKLQDKFDGLLLEAFLPKDSSFSHADTIAVLTLAQPGAYFFQNCTSTSHLWLPERALFSLQAEEKDACKWGVQARMYDMHRGFAVYRKERFALTFRKGKLPRAVQSEVVPTPSFLQQYVHSTYDQIASHFDHTRYRPWPQVQRFMSSLAPGSLVLDIGCGNGKYLSARPDCTLIGLERSQSLVDIVAKKGLTILRGDALAVPLRSNSLDAVLCVAVIHHFPTEEMRLQALQEILRVLKPGGLALIYVWAKEQSERLFDSSDCLLPWHSNEKPALLRYYHVFEKGELEALVSKATSQAKVESSYYDHSNWCVVVRKVI
jgi:SAM-dependent methyltransferase